MIKTFCVALAIAVPVAGVNAQAADATKAYVDAGFAAMDTNKDGNVTRAEFGAFMRARLDRQAAEFDAAFKQLDSNADGKITQAEASAGNALLAAHFAEVDANHDGNISKEELRSAMLAAQAR